MLYLLGLLWFFLGVSIIADVFMAAIETITSKEKKVPGTDVSFPFFATSPDCGAKSASCNTGSSAPAMRRHCAGAARLSTFD